METGIVTGTSFEPQGTVRNWLASPLGQALLVQESQMLEQALEGVFGEYCLQLGQWGDASTFLRHARTRRQLAVSEPDGALAAAEPGAIGRLYRLPLSSESVDAVILPHILEYSRRPHAILREVHRVLRADGYLIILGFKPGGLWGVRRLIPGAGMPPGVNTMIADRQLCDWMKLLDLHIHGVTRYFFRWPLSGNRTLESQLWEQRGRRWWPELAACYMLSAQKRVIPMTTLRMPWRARPKVVGGLVKPTTRQLPDEPS
ncbi:MAG: class I SAM-dependent methyltransferase [Halioglobus sp.]|nr:class I SAM-dependent methyltransferase [Halioglobus sp.]